MRKFTKLLMALALTIVAVGGAKAEQVYKVVYSDYTEFPWYVMGYTPTWNAGIMTDDGANQEPAVTDWHQYYIATGIPTVVGNDYTVKALVRCNAYFDLGVSMGWGFGEGESKSGSVHLTPTDDFVWVEWSYKGIGATSCYLIAQPWSGNTKFEWKELAVYTADPQCDPVFGDLHVVTPHIYAKNAGEGWGKPATPTEGVYTVESVDNAGAADWDTQFWIATPEPGLPAGQKFYVEFSYKAEHEAAVSTQTQLEENGGYKTWHCVGEGESKSDFTFTTGWKSIAKEVTIEDDMAGWRSIAFNLNKDKTANKYYFKDIVLKVPELSSGTIDFSVGAAGWATYSSVYNADLGSAKGYAAKINGSSVELSQVTQVPANNAVLIEEAGKHTFNIIASATAIAENDLKVSDGNVTSDGSNTIYTLANYPSKNGLGFYKVPAGKKVPKGKAYLKVAVTSAPEFLGFDGGTTSINEKTAVKNNVEGVYYNLAGQRVAQPTKGLYIVNGKKVVIK